MVEMYVYFLLVGLPSSSSKSRDSEKLILKRARLSLDWKFMEHRLYSHSTWFSKGLIWLIDWFNSMSTYVELFYT